MEYLDCYITELKALKEFALQDAKAGGEDDRDHLFHIGRFRAYSDALNLALKLKQNMST